MSILDRLWEFSDAQALTAVGTTASTNIVMVRTGADAWGTALIQDPGESGRLWLTVSVNTVFTNGATGTLAIAVQGAPSSATGSFATIMTLLAATTLCTPSAVAPNVAGTRLIRMPLPADPVATYDHFRLLYTIAGSAFTAGNVDAYITLGPTRG